MMDNNAKFHVGSAGMEYCITKDRKEAYGILVIWEPAMEKYNLPAAAQPVFAALPC